MLNFRVDNKVAIVTGCNQGIGMAIALGLAEQGADIIGVSNVMPADSEVEKGVKALGRNFYPYQVDLTDRKQLYSFTEQVKKDHPVIDILINNAGHIMRAPSAEHPDEYWDLIINLNLNAQFLLTREIGKGMIERKSGKIVFACSMLSYQGGINVPGYAASKGAVASLLKTFANEWSKFGVNVNGVAPGYVATSNTQQLRDDEDRNAAILARIPIGRWATPEDIAKGYVFLCTPAADYITGTILNVDGGWMAR